MKGSQNSKPNKTERLEGAKSMTNLGVKQTDHTKTVHVPWYQNLDCKEKEQKLEAKQLKEQHAQTTRKPGANCYRNLFKSDREAARIDQNMARYADNKVGAQLFKHVDDVEKMNPAISLNYVVNPGIKSQTDLRASRLKDLLAKNDKTAI